ncbi:enoyl-CoA hydratase/isomerase family protein [Micromonospora sp. WMMD736]|uniref:enoyl-CoA hydratase/isomerase family protein n=1 Tax=Micromonospora sp. WMMD736 TaxID=3404112 RepID=UPI003B966375
MTAARLVLIERPEAGIAIIRLNRPSRKNCLTMELITAFHAVLDEIDSDEDCRVVILTGAGRSFCAGADYELVDLVSPRLHGVEGVTRSINWNADLVLRMQGLRQPVIAAIDGDAAGGGFALALGADIRVSSHDARFCVAFTKIGLAGAEMGLSYTLPRVIGPTAAFEMMLTSRIMAADEAFRLGLTLAPVDVDQLLPTALGIARQIASKSPYAIHQTKAMLWRHLAATDIRSVIDAESKIQVLALLSEGHQAAMAPIHAKAAADVSDAGSLK